MSSDRELLELAAKAAGYPWRGFSADGRPLLSADVSKPEPRICCPCVWNPLEDDGDALRLACDLGLRVYPVARTSSGAACSAVGSVTSERLAEVSDMSLDTRGATRRAIVRAAAEIGRSAA